MDIEALLSEVDQFAEAHGISPATVTSKAVGNSRLYSRMRNGGSCTIRIAERLRAYMAANPPASSEEDAA